MDVGESSLVESDGSTTQAVTVKTSTVIYLVEARHNLSRNHWPEKAFPTKQSAEAYASTKNLSYDGKFYTVLPIMLGSIL